MISLLQVACDLNTEKPIKHPKGVYVMSEQHSKEYFQGLKQKVDQLKDSTTVIDVTGYDSRGSYQGEGWAVGYSPGLQPQLASFEVKGAGEKLKYHFDNSGQLVVDNGKELEIKKKYIYIKCCVPSNLESKCNFSNKSNNCIRY